MLPSGFGLNPTGGNTLADREVMNWGVNYILADGEFVALDTVSTTAVKGFYLFAEAFPFNVAFETAPGVSVDLWWLVVLP